MPIQTDYCINLSNTRIDLVTFLLLKNKPTFLFSDIGLSYKMEMTNYYNSILWIYQNNQTIYESLEAQIHSICYYNHVKRLDFTFHFQGPDTFNFRFKGQYITS